MWRMITRLTRDKSGHRIQDVNPGEHLEMINPKTITLPTIILDVLKTEGIRMIVSHFCF